MCHYRRPTEAGCGWGQGTGQHGKSPLSNLPILRRLQAPVESICTYPRVPSPARTSPVPGPLPYPRGSKGPFSPAPAARALSPGRVARVGWSSVCPVPHMFVPHMFPVPPSPSLFRSAGPNPGWGQGKFSKASLKASGTSLGWTRPFHADPGVGPGQCGKPLPAYLAVRFLPCPHVTVPAARAQSSAPVPPLSPASVPPPRWPVPAHTCPAPAHLRMCVPAAVPCPWRCPWRSSLASAAVPGVRSRLALPPTPCTVPAAVPRSCPLSPRAVQFAVPRRVPCPRSN